VAIELVQVDPVGNSSTGVQVLLFARSETEVTLLQRKVGLATSAPRQSALPFLLLPTGNASVGEPRTVLITVDIHFEARRRSRESEALFAVTTEMSEYFDVAVYTISYTIEESMSMQTPRVRISVMQLGLPVQRREIILGNLPLRMVALLKKDIEAGNNAHVSLIY
jgi:hypothetical protein